MRTGSLSKKRLVILVIHCLFLFLLGGCYTSPTNTNNGGHAGNSGGSASEVVGKIEQPDSTNSVNKMIASVISGIPAVGAYIYLYPDSFVADTTMAPGDYVPRATTGADGRFRISQVVRGSWVLEASDGTHALMKRFVVDGSGDEIDLGTLILAAPSSLDITLSTELGSSVAISYYVYILGTRFFAAGDNESLSLLLQGIPGGEVGSIRVQVVEPVPYTVTLDSVTFESGKAVSRAIELPW